MARALLPIIILTSLAHLSPALSESGELAKQELHAAIKAEDLSRAKPGSKRPSENGVAYISNLDLRLTEGDSRQIDDSLSRITDNYRSPAVAQAVEKLRNTLSLEAKKRENDELAQVDALKKEVSESIPKAAKAKDLDNLVDRLVELMNSNSDQRSEKATEAVQSLIPLKIFTSDWQNFLNAHEAGERDRADRILSYLISRNEQLPVPRSLVISRMSKTTPAPATPPPGAPPLTPPQPRKEITELDQMAQAILELRELQGNSSSKTPEQNPASIPLSILALTPLEKTYRDFKAGLPTDLGFLTLKNDSSNQAAAMPSISLLRAKLLLLVLPGQLGLKDDQAPGSGETVTAFLGRAEKEAAERGDAATCIRVIEARLAIEPAGSGAETEKSALNHFKTGQARETAELPFMAVLSYQHSLTSGPGEPLALLIGRRLREINRTHPEEYKKAFERYLSSR